MIQTYQDLILLTKKYILQEYKEGDLNENKEWVECEIANYQSFKAYALQNKNETASKKTIPLQAPITKKIEPAPVPAKKFEQDLIIEKTVDQPPVKQPISEPPKLNDQPKSRSFELEPLKPKAPADLSDIRKIVQEILPHLVILDKIPDSEPQIIILSDSPEKRIQLFLKNVLKAIDLRFGTCKILSTKQWLRSKNFPKLKILIKTDLQQDISNELPSSCKTIDLLEIENFFKEPHTKSNLWKKIENALLS